MAKAKLYFCVCEDYHGNIVVSSFGGSNKAEERGFGETMYRKVHHVLTSHDHAQSAARQIRAEMIRSSQLGK